MRLLHLTIAFTNFIGKLSCAAIPSPETHFSDSHPAWCLGPLRRGGLSKAGFKY